MSTYDLGVFINVPFDRRYKKLFDALVFAVHDCGFVAHCSKEEGDSSNVRVQTIGSIINQCRFGIHDLSRTTLDSIHRLPRFNMPLELGIFLGAKRFGNAQQRTKSCLILERDAYRFQIFCSDIGGQDIAAHHNRVEDAITAVRDWLRTVRKNSAQIPGGRRIAERYVAFRRDLPRMCKTEGLDVRDITFFDYRTMIIGWLEENEW
jgi:hypothetical protein